MKAIFFVTMMTGLFITAPVDVTGERVGPRTIFNWDAVTQDINGNPEVIGSYEVAFAIPPADVRTGGVAIKMTKVAANMTQIAMSDQIASLGLAEGSSLRVWVRAYDLAGNVSDWSNMVEGTIDTIRPNPPDKTRVQR